MPGTPKEVQAGFCRLLCIRKKALQKNLKQTKPPTSLFIDKTLKITKPQLKTNTGRDTVCSELRLQFIKK